MVLVVQRPFSRFLISAPQTVLDPSFSLDTQLLVDGEISMDRINGIPTTEYSCLFDVLGPDKNDVNGFNGTAIMTQIPPGSPIQFPNAKATLRLDSKIPQGQTTSKWDNNCTNCSTQTHRISDPEWFTISDIKRNGSPFDGLVADFNAIKSDAALVNEDNDSDGDGLPNYALCSLFPEVKPVCTTGLCVSSKTSDVDTLHVARVDASGNVVLDTNGEPVTDPLLAGTGPHALVGRPAPRGLYLAEHHPTQFLSGQGAKCATVPAKVSNARKFMRACLPTQNIGQPNEACAGNQPSRYPALDSTKAPNDVALYFDKFLITDLTEDGLQDVAAVGKETSTGTTNVLRIWEQVAVQGYSHTLLIPRSPDSVFPCYSSPVPGKCTTPIVSGTMAPTDIEMNRNHIANAFEALGLITAPLVSDQDARRVVRIHTADPNSTNIYQNGTHLFYDHWNTGGTAREWNLVTGANINNHQEGSAISSNFTVQYAGGNPLNPNNWLCSMLSWIMHPYRSTVPNPPANTTIGYDHLNSTLLNLAQTQLHSDLLTGYWKDVLQIPFMTNFNGMQFLTTGVLTYSPSQAQYGPTAGRTDFFTAQP